MQVFLQRNIGLSAVQRVRSIRYLTVASRSQVLAPLPRYFTRFASCHPLSPGHILPFLNSSRRFRSFSNLSDKPSEKDKASLDQQQGLQTNDPIKQEEQRMQNWDLMQQYQMMYQNQPPVEQPSGKKGWSRRTKIILGILSFMIFSFVVFMTYLGYALRKIFEKMSYASKLRDVFDVLDEDHDGLVSMGHLLLKWSSLKEEVAKWKPKEEHAGDFKVFWSRLVEIGDQTLEDCNDTVINIFQFSDILAAVLFTAANEDGQDFVTETDLRALAAKVPDMKTKDIDKLMEIIFTEFDLDQDGQITLQDVQFRLRAELNKDGSLSADL